MDSARALVAGGWRISLVSRTMGMSRAPLSLRINRSAYWQERRRKRKPDDIEALDRIHTVIGDLPTYGYRRVWVLLRRQSETDDMAVINAKRVQGASLPSTVDDPAFIVLVAHFVSVNPAPYVAIKPMLVT